MNQHDADAVAQIQREMYNRSAATYIDSTAKLTTLAVDLLIEAARLTRDSHALEVGCGPGHITKLMADTGARVTGIDVAPAMVKVASELYQNIEFKEGNGEHLPFDADTFDVVLVNYVMHHFGRPEQACAEIHRVLKHGGRLVLAGPSEGFGFSALREAVTEHHTRGERPRGSISNRATQADYESLLQEAGFSDYDVNVHQMTLHLESLEPLIETGRQMWELSKLPREIQDRIRDATAEKTAPYRTDRGYEFPERVVVGVATK